MLSLFILNTQMPVSMDMAAMKIFAYILWLL